MIGIGHPIFPMTTKMYSTTVFRPPGSGSIIQDYESADPDPKEIVTDPQSKKCAVL